MFGYIVANEPELKIGEYRLYRSYYCGLCRDLRDSYGGIGQLTLSYDTTFLSFLLTSLYEPADEAQGQTRCIAHPFEDHPTRRNEFTRYCADITVLLSYYAALDDWKDERSVKKLAASRLLRSGRDRAAERWKEKAEAAERQLALLHRYEEEGSSDLDAVSGAFGELMAEFFVCRKDIWEPTLRRMGFYLGKFIYLLDAYDDLEEDRKNGSYNPLLLSMDGDPALDDRVRQILTMMMAECCSAFETLPIVENVGILRNILYSGVWTRYDAVREQRMKGSPAADASDTQPGAEIKDAPETDAPDAQPGAEMKDAPETDAPDAQPGAATEHREETDDVGSL